MSRPRRGVVGSGCRSPKWMGQRERRDVVEPLEISSAYADRLFLTAALSCDECRRRTLNAH
jgi:hypothetical protein